MKFVNPRWQFIFQYKLLKRELLAANFRDGLALVEKDGKLMYIDHSGAVVWEER